MLIKIWCDICRKEVSFKLKSIKSKDGLRDEVTLILDGKMLVDKIICSSCLAREFGLTYRRVNTNKEKIKIANEVLGSIADENGIVDRQELIKKLCDVFQISNSEAEDIIDMMIDKGYWFAPRPDKIGKV